MPLTTAFLLLQEADQGSHDMKPLNTELTLWRFEGILVSAKPKISHGKGIFNDGGQTIKQAVQKG